MLTENSPCWKTRGAIIEVAMSPAHQPRISAYRKNALSDDGVTPDAQTSVVMLVNLLREQGIDIGDADHIERSLFSK
jgi:hypothetical protein